MAKQRPLTATQKNKSIKKKTSQCSSLKRCKTSNLSKSKKRSYKPYNRQGR